MTPFDKDGKWVRKPVYTKENNENTSKPSNDLNLNRGSQLFKIILSASSIFFVSGVIYAFMYSQPTSKKLKERCLLGYEKEYESGSSKAIQSVDHCLDLLAQIGPTALKINPLTHQACGAGYGVGLGEYLLCVTDNNSKWKISKELIEARDKAKRKRALETQAYLNEILKKGRNFEKEQNAVMYKGKKYYPSRICEPGTQMRWQKTSGLFRSKITEIGCMTDREEEKYWRDYNAQRANRPVIINQPTYRPSVNCTGQDMGYGSFNWSCY